ncbi:MAG TPA: hypothetical protein VFQ06_15540 [Nitrospira sp.]|nr:hypothetical protein [Nitrospira sp.]
MADEPKIWETVPLTWQRWLTMELVRKNLVWYDLKNQTLRRVLTKRGSRLLEPAANFLLEYDLVTLSEEARQPWGWHKCELSDLGRELWTRWSKELEAGE